MKTTQTTAAILDLRASGYGAVEIKKQMRANTFRGFGLTTSAIALFFLLYWGLTGKEKIQPPELTRGTTPIVITDFLTPPETVVPTGIIPEPVFVKGVGLEVVAGKFVGVDDDLISEDAPKIATVAEMGRASHIGTPGGFDDGVTIDQNVGRIPAASGIQIEKQAIAEPDPDIFVPVEKEPAIDLARLQSSIVYPELARRARVEGTVLLQVLVGADGSVKQVVVKESDNILLDEAAKQAMLKYGKVPPALQNGEAIACWVYVPIKFRLR